MNNLKLKNSGLILSSQDKGNLVGFFELLIKVDKRINPHLYQKTTVIGNPLLWKDKQLQCKE